MELNIGDKVYAIHFHFDPDDGLFSMPYLYTNSEVDNISIIELKVKGYTQNTGFHSIDYEGYILEDTNSVCYINTRSSTLYERITKSKGDTPVQYKCLTTVMQEMKNGIDRIQRIIEFVNGGLSEEEVLVLKEKQGLLVELIQRVVDIFTKNYKRDIMYKIETVSQHVPVTVWRCSII